LHRPNVGVVGEITYSLIKSVYRFADVISCLEPKQKLAVRFFQWRRREFPRHMVCTHRNPLFVTNVVYLAVMCTPVQDVAMVMMISLEGG